MSILTVPAAAAQEVANLLVNAGIMGILNFAPIALSVPEEVMVNNVNLAIELEYLAVTLFRNDGTLTAARCSQVRPRQGLNCRRRFL